MVKNNVISSRIGLFLRSARKEKKLTGKKLAKLMNVSQQQISRYETGITSITLDQLNELLIILDKSWFDAVSYIERENESGVRGNSAKNKYLSSSIHLYNKSLR